MLICLPSRRTLWLDIRDASFYFLLFLLLEAVKSINRAEKVLPSYAYGEPLPFPDSSRWACTGVLKLMSTQSCCFSSHPKDEKC